MAKETKTSWEGSSKWYDSIVGEKGHYYHQQVILPKLLQLLHLSSNDKLLDLGCGQGILERALPEQVAYTGIDLSGQLIGFAKGKCQNKNHRFLKGDITTPLPIEKDFSHAVILLALQNLDAPKEALKNAALHLKKEGHLVIVVNHPCFRIPRLSHWGVDEGKKLQYRRLDAYLSSQKIPIQTHPGQNQSETTWSFHHPLSSYTRWLSEAGFVILDMEEWISDKASEGPKARMEDRARKEFPLFLAIHAKKI